MRTKADQILPAAQAQRLAHQIVIGRVAILQEGALHGLFVRIFGDIDRLHRPRVQARVVHAGRERTGRGVEVLHLLRHIAQGPQILRQGD